MHPIWAQGRARVGALALGLSDHALGCGKAPALGVSAHRVGAHAGHQPQVTDLGSLRSPTTLGPSCSGMGCRALGILCRCTHPGLGASGSLAPQRARGVPQGASTHMAVTSGKSSRRAQEGCTPPSVASPLPPGVGETSERRGPHQH